MRAMRASASRTASQNRRIAAASLMPLRDFDAGAHVNGPGPHARTPSITFAGIQPTRQNERKGHAGWNE